MSHSQHAICPKCSHRITSPANFVPSANENLPSTHVGYVKVGLIYMVTDALVVKPLTTMSIVELLNQFNLNKMAGSLEEKVVDDTVHQVRIHQIIHLSNIE